METWHVRAPKVWCQDLSANCSTKENGIHRWLGWPESCGIPSMPLVTGQLTNFIVIIYCCCFNFKQKLYLNLIWEDTRGLRFIRRKFNQQFSFLFSFLVQSIKLYLIEKQWKKWFCKRHLRLLLAWKTIFLIIITCYMRLLA